jgi:excisionase family DNA binding protein
MTDFPPVLNVKLATQFLNVSTKTVYEYVDRGTLPHRRLGNRILFSRDALTKWVEEGQSSKVERLLKVAKGTR